MFYAIARCVWVCICCAMLAGSVFALGKGSRPSNPNYEEQERRAKEGEAYQWRSNVKDYPPREAYEHGCNKSDKRDDCLLLWRSTRAAEIQAKAAVDQVYWSHAAFWFLVFTFGATFAAALFARQAANATFQSAQEARRSADVAERTLIATLGASVLLKNVERKGILDPATGKVAGWRFEAVWENIGGTQTKDGVWVFNGMRHPSALPADHIFVSAVEPGHVVIGPRSTARSGAIDITAADVNAILKGEAFYYLWGWCEYGLMQADTPRYQTDFCVRVVFEGDPLAQRGGCMLLMHGKQQGQREIKSAPKQA